MVTWGEAFRSALIYVLLSIVWVIVGIAIVFAGYLVIAGSLVSSVTSIFGGGGMSINWGGVAGGLILIIIGWAVAFFGLIATFFKINSEVIAQEVKRQISPSVSTPQPVAYQPPPSQQPVQTTPFCPTCGSPLRYIQQYQRWYCDKEAKYV
jgi:hypothetical protein